MTYRSLRRLLYLAAILLVTLSAFFTAISPAFAAGETAGAPADDNAGDPEGSTAVDPVVISFTPEEEAFIASHPSVKVGYVQDRIPVSFMNDKGELDGISRYIFDRVSELCGIEFEYMPLPTGDVTYDYLLGEGFDLVTSVEYNEENKNARGILMSVPYLSGQKVVVGRKDLDFSYDAHLTIAISTGSQTLRKVLGASYPNFELVDYPSISACFDAVNSGEADLMIQNQYVAEYWFSKPIYEDLQVLPVFGLDDRLCFSAVVTFDGVSAAGASSPEEGRILIDILDKAITHISEDEVSAYTIRAIMENQYVYDFSDFIHRYRYAVEICIVSLIIVITLSVVLIRLRIRYAEDKADAKAKGQFLSTMSHEIRTPLNGLIGLNYLMSQKIDDKEQLAAYLDQSTSTAKYLLSLVNDILDMSKLQEKKMELLIRPVRLDLLLDTVRSMVSNAMADKGLSFSTDVELAYPCVTGDEVRIQQVLLNLLDNARKFTPEGGKVELTLKQEKAHDGKVLTSVTVTDTGRGMSEEFQKRIFDAFAQELITVSKGNQGTGLGLPISRSLAKLMGGDLTFVSKKDKGSSFTFTFLGEPSEDGAAGGNDGAAAGENACGAAGENACGATGAGSAGNTAATSAAGGNDGAATSATEAHTPLSILVAEDNELNGEIIIELLRGGGFTAELAVNGAAAVEAFKNSPTGTYDVILMDLLMPEMDGFAATKAIRAMERPDAKTVRIFACTANAFSEDRDKALESGMDDFIAKPIDIEQLLAKLSRR